MEHQAYPFIMKSLITTYDSFLKLMSILSVLMIIRQDKGIEIIMLKKQ